MIMILIENYDHFFFLLHRSWQRFLFSKILKKDLSVYYSKCNKPILRLTIHCKTTIRGKIMKITILGDIHFGFWFKS